MTILFVGRSTFDLGYACPAFPQENAKLSATRFWAGAGGCALNAAVTARALGSEVRLLTLLGAGAFAVAVREELARFDVLADDFADPATQLLPVSSIIVVQESGSRTIVDQQPPQELAREADHAALLDLAGMVLVDGFLPDLAIPLCREARARGIPVVLDGGSWKPRSGELMPHIDIAVVSERFRPGGEEHADVLAAVHALGPGKVAVTRGERPLSWSDGNRRGEIAPPQVDAIDTLGAGDVFHGAFCHFLQQGADFVSSLERASEVAAQSCRHYGTRGWIEA
jgi:sugar/nucleoside kinase (ribokinase family)